MPYIVENPQNDFQLCQVFFSVWTSNARWSHTQKAGEMARNELECVSGISDISLPPHLSQYLHTRWIDRQTDRQTYQSELYSTFWSKLKCVNQIWSFIMNQTIVSRRSVSSPHNGSIFRVSGYGPSYHLPLENLELHMQGLNVGHLSGKTRLYCWVTDLLLKDRL